MMFKLSNGVKATSKQDLINKVHQQINSFNMKKVKQFRANGFGSVVQKKVEDMTARFGLQQVGTGLARGKKMLGQYNENVLVEMYNAMQEHNTDSKTGTVNRYIKHVNTSNPVLNERIGEITGNDLSSFTEKEKAQFLQSFFDRMDNLKASKQKDYDSEQIMRETFMDMFPDSTDDLIREVHRTEERAKAFTRSIKTRTPGIKRERQRE